MLEYKHRLPSRTPNIIDINVTGYRICNSERTNVVYDDFKDKIAIIAQCDEPCELQMYNSIYSICNIVEFNDYQGTNIYDLKEEYTVNYISEDKCQFQFYVNRYYQLSLYNMYKSTNNKNETTWFFNFDKPHFYKNPDIVDTDDVTDVPDNILLILRFVNPTTQVEEDITLEGTYQTTRQITCTIDMSNESIQILDNLIFDTQDTTEEFPFVLYRPQFYFKEFATKGITTNMYKDEIIASLQIPIYETFSTNLLSQEMFNEFIVEKERKKLITDIVDMEKNVYYPVMLCDADGNAFKDVERIKFNLHFRQHGGEEWTVDNDKFWNGVDNETIQFTNKNFFSYDNKSEQSDLLSYLGFTNNDVKFQKSKLKKSFLRLSFFNSTDPASQDLLFYSTIFLDGGKQFTNFTKNLRTKPYIESGSEEITLLEGLKTNREPYGKLLKQLKEDGEDLEDYRLSSQFVVENKHNSVSSSEGMYIFLWKEFFEGEMPQDLYMKVEFNHAGYGRVIPFMMPFWDKRNPNVEQEGKGGIKTFDEILADWRNDTDTVNDGVYTIQKYNKFSYIHLKYRYDKEANKYIYYLDNETYGKSAYTEDCENFDGTLTFNLYEAKIGSDMTHENVRRALAQRNYTYGEIIIDEFEYRTVPNSGGLAAVILNYHQDCYIVEDGKEELYNTYYNSGEVEYTNFEPYDVITEDDYVIFDNGNVRFSCVNTSTGDKRDLMNVSVTIYGYDNQTANGETIIRQAPANESTLLYVEEWKITEYGFKIDEYINNTIDVDYDGKDNINIIITIERQLAYDDGRFVAEKLDFNNPIESSDTYYYRVDKVELCGKEITDGGTITVNNDKDTINIVTKDNYILNVTENNTSNEYNTPLPIKVTISKLNAENEVIASKDLTSNINYVQTTRTPAIFTFEDGTTVQNESNLTNEEQLFIYYIISYDSEGNLVEPTCDNDMVKIEWNEEFELYTAIVNIPPNEEGSEYHFIITRSDIDNVLTINMNQVGTKYVFEYNDTPTVTSKTIEFGNENTSTKEIIIHTYTDDENV